MPQIYSKTPEYFLKSVRVDTSSRLAIKIGTTLNCESFLNGNFYS